MDQKENQNNQEKFATYEICQTALCNNTFALTLDEKKRESLLFCLSCNKDYHKTTEKERRTNIRLNTTVSIFKNKFLLDQKSK